MDVLHHTQLAGQNRLKMAEIVTRNQNSHSPNKHINNHSEITKTLKETLKSNELLSSVIFLFLKIFIFEGFGSVCPIFALL